MGDQTDAVVHTPRELCELMGVDLSDQQLDAVVAPLEPGVIVAGAGSGKTTVMAARVVWLVLRAEVRRDQVLGLTFTNKAAAELGARVRQALAGALARAGAAVAPDDADEPTVATYHAFAGRLITEHGLRLGIEPDTRVMADATRFQLAASVIRGHRGDLRQLNTYLPNLVTDLLNLDAQMSEHLVSAADVLQLDAVVRKQLADAKQIQDIVKAADATRRRDELLELVAAYRDAKRHRGVMDFSDQMALGATIAEECPEVGALERDRFRVVLLDEYQDTSVAQRRMLCGLFSGTSAATGRGHPVTAVGDPCQAIYGWRGASVANLDEFPRHFLRGDGAPAQRHALSVNRRCDVSVLAAANSLARPLYAEHAGVEALSARPQAAPGRVDVGLLATHADEMGWVAARVHQVRDSMGIRWSDIGVLVHDNADARHLQVQLRRLGVPVEVVGLGGLLTRPEVADVVATLEVIHDLTANAAMLRLLTGPRWRVGPRDLALLGRRARRLARPDGDGDRGGLADALADAVGGTDPTEVVSLADALEDPGDLGYSAEARERFALLAEEIGGLRRHAGEPLVDLVRRVVDTTGLDVELSASASAVAAQGRDNLASFVDAVASYAGVDADASLPGLLAYLEAEDEFGTGLAVAAPSEADSVKLMTVHKAKGLEWDVVFLPALVRDVFPSSRGRPRWTSTHKELPWPLRGDVDSLPDVPDWSGKGLKAFAAAAKEQDLLEERRLAYVALTRARHLLVGSGHWWGRTQKRPRGPSDYLEHLRSCVGDDGRQPLTWAEPPADGDANPMLEEARSVVWPAELDTAEIESRRRAADLVRRARDAGLATDEDDLRLDEQAQVAEWDRELDRLLAEARASRDPERTVELPSTLSATALMRLSVDPEGLARELVRPMPRRPSTAARFGTRFHAWVEAYVGQQQLLDPADIPGAADEGIDSDAELAALTEAFRAGPFGSRVPHRVEAPFALALAGRVVRGRIDAVYATERGFEVVDWKTNQEQSADPLQLGIYRLAWSELTGTPLEQVTASFYYVRTGDLVTPADLPTRDELESLVEL
ncbi:MAG TPA: UvrD-helicase domain-containing protein [Nocardioidaceae bacterium]|nr:UvrD-helicase domain-containing protein [Nocardioidaceae bacterium]